MRASYLVFGALVSLGTGGLLVACATSSNDPGVAPLDGSSVVVPEAAPTVDADADTAVVPDGHVERPTCSAAGWCTTVLPDADLSMKDIWPVGKHAFAIAESPTLGVRVLQWSDDTQSWSYIDDGTQNFDGLGNYAGRIWAPDENEVFFGVGPGYMFHGTRPTAPGTPWTWSKQNLQPASDAGPGDPFAGYPNDRFMGMNYPTLGVFGTSRDDVYAWFRNTIYRWTSKAGGDHEWVVDYVANDVDVDGEQIFFLGGAGLSADGVWFSGARARKFVACPLLIRKTSTGYRRLVDGQFPGDFSDCEDRPDTVRIGARGWLVDINAISPTEVIGLHEGRVISRVSDEGGNTTFVQAEVVYDVSPNPFSGLWWTPTDVWLSGKGLLFRSGSEIWDGGAFGISTIALGEAPSTRPIYEIRGTSNTNIWAIGVRYALHKTTP
ncbi:hypothetical protein AKJ09_00505 [Labilithrix luteola]|uniref:Type IV fimbrial biogenesis protein PilY1 n=1 Tax=Labilithrix luteola TaxID=1391654 RepID=A0A0K1PKC6_9BACT|nr:hypothetical protein [Labilithrix luteola]AKU93841.1 hypothetical protein AKJ09_00505 [Labilithrix luteola]